MLNCDHPLQRRLLQAGWRHRFRPAVSAPGYRTVSHLELVIRAMARSRRLLAYHDRLDNPVALRFPKTTELVEHLMAVLFAGGTYVCLDRNATGEDRLALLRALGVKLLLHRGEEGPSDEMLSDSGILCLGPGAGWPVPLWPARKRAVPEAWSCALVRTSGTSGEPCGVLQEAHSVLHHAEWTITSQGIDERSRLSWLASPGVAAAHSHLFASLLSGACLCPFEPARESLGAMSRWMLDERITHLHLTPSLLRAWLESLPEGAAFPDLRCVKLGGEPARAADVRLLRRRLGSGPRLFNGLGMSEATGNVVLHEITERDEAGDGLLPVGRAVKDRMVIVEREPGCAAGLGEVGEIVVRDRWVSPGYHPPGARGSISETHEPGVRQLRTGDAGRWDPEGRLIHLGRLDRRIRVGGITVDLAEVEARVASLEPVRQVAALPEPESRGYRVAVALRESGEQGRAAVKSLLRGLPGVRPTRVAFVADIPRKESGKRDDDALLRNWPAGETAAAWTPREAFIRDAWSRVLGHAEFGPDDRFAEVGGDSLSALNLALELERISHREVGMADLARFPTVAAQASALEAGQLGAQGGRPVHQSFHVEWVAIPAAEPKRMALVHPGGYCRETDVWLAREVLSELAGDTSLMVARSNIEDDHIQAPAHWSELIDPLMPGIPEAANPLLVGVCLGALVVSELAERLSARANSTVDLVLLDPWTPGLGRSAAGLAQGEHPDRIRRYFELFKEREYPQLSALRHVVLSREDSHFEERRRFWGERVPSSECLHVVPGDHLSFLREHCGETARTLAAAVRTPR